MYMSWEGAVRSSNNFYSDSIFAMVLAHVRIQSIAAILAGGKEEPSKQATRRVPALLPRHLVPPKNQVITDMRSGTHAS